MRRTAAAAFSFALLSAIAWAGAPQGSHAITFSNEVVRILQAKCQTCHHPGDIAPFSLVTYEDAAPWADAIREKTTSREMPPWKAADGCGDFLEPRTLTDAEIATIAEWVEAGSPEGDRADLPEPVAFPDEWRLGEPDAVLSTAPRGFRIAASEDHDVYRCFSLETGFDADRFISAVEVRPGNRAIVHHVLLFVDRTGVSAELDAADPRPGYTCFGGPGFLPSGGLGGWAPGAGPAVQPDGVGMLVPRGARVVAQVHYRPTGLDEVDETRIGLHFARSPVFQDAISLPLINRSFTIPAGARGYPVTASITLPAHVNLTLRSIAPHMHLLGREMAVTATLPDGQDLCLIDIRDWDFHWQGGYRYREPIRLPGGTRLDLVARYDNTDDNPEQPNAPPADVSWGERTTDEMCIAFLGITVDAERRTPSTPSVSRVAIDDGRLVVEGTDVRRGARIEVDGRLLGDTRVGSRRRATSRAEWRSAIAPGTTVSVSVLNPDGARSAPVAFLSSGL